MLPFRHEQKDELRAYVNDLGRIFLENIQHMIFKARFLVTEETKMKSYFEELIPSIHLLIRRK